MMKRIYLVRGLPGSGKTTMAKLLEQAHAADGAVHFEADQYFVGDDGVYRYNPGQIKNAHRWCQEQVRVAALADTPVIIVSNTFVRHWEMDDYFAIAAVNGYEIVTVVMDNNNTAEFYAQRNIHGVPLEKIEQMQENWEH